MSVDSVKKATRRKELPKKDHNKQLKISSFFSAGRSGSTTNLNGDNKQSKISKYFSLSKSGVHNKADNELSGKSTILKHDFVDGNTKFEEIDLTEEDSTDNIKKPLSPVVNKIMTHTRNKELKNGLKNGKEGISINFKKSEKENSPTKNNCETPISKIFNGIKDHRKDIDCSPEVISPTPPKNLSICKHKGTKRKFDFSNIDISSEKCTEPHLNGGERLNGCYSKNKKLNLSNDLKLITTENKLGKMGRNNCKNSAKELSKEDELKDIDIEDISNKFNFERVSGNKKLSDSPKDDTDSAHSYNKLCKSLNVVNNDDIYKVLDNHSCDSKNWKSENDLLVSCTKPKKLSSPDVENISITTLNNQSRDSSDPESVKSVKKCDDEIVTHESIPNGYGQYESIVKDNNDYGLTDDILFEDWSQKEETLIKNRDMNLEKCKRCTVILVNQNYGKNDTQIRIEDYVNSNVTDCLLQGSWTNLTLKEGNLVSVLAEWNDDLGWIITNTSGYVVLEPDTLIAGTTLVGSLFCMRRAILTDMFRGLDPTSEVMVIGSLLHEILQEVLKQKLRNRYEIEKVINKIISTNDFTFTLYSSNISMANVKKQLDIFIPQILKFVSSYIAPVTEVSNNDSWRGEITAIEDIEENIWATNLGLKGKIDVTVKVRSQNKTKIMPLELKTGRASFSSEHRGQVILYSLMMTEIGKDVDSGLLLYLREGVMKEVKAGVMEKRDLILLRNEFIQFTNERQEVGNINDGLIGAPNLPQPINHLRGCSTCPYLTICSAAIKESGLEKLPSKNALHGLVFPATDHLKSEHIRFVFHWVGLLQLEHKEVRRNMFSVKDIWNLNPEERERKKSGLCNLRLEGKVIENDYGRYKHTFVREELMDGIITKGDYVIVSSTERVAVASGIVSDITASSCTINLERDLSSYKNLKFHLDRYDSQTILMYNMTNLGYLLEAAPECGWLRDKIISLELPVYSRLSSEVLRVGQDLLSKLNKGQKHAVLQALASQHYLLIKGMPGTGKTATLVSLIELLVRLGQSILVTSHTHSAVDNVLRRLPRKIKVLRLGSLAKIHPEMHDYSEQNISASTPEELEVIFNSKQVVGVTCLGAGHPLLRRRKFDVVLVDEATQVHLPTTLRPLFAASRFILVGDPKQLPPLVKSQHASELGLRQSLFSYLDRPSVTAELRTQYRMNKCITDLANGLTYEGKLECANEEVSQATITLGSIEEDYPAWMSPVLSTSLDSSVVVLDSGFDITAKSSSEREVDYVVQIVKMFLKIGMNEYQLGIIAPFQAQVALIRNSFKCDDIDVEVSTVDTFQGRDKDVIIYSCTRSGHATDISLLSDHNRMTVAITRARHKLIFIGDVKTLKGYAVFEKLFSLINPSNVVTIATQDS